ncbi:MAG: helix-turn-helix domain-containing protein [Candidatus Dormibacteraeota bacterium]|nr:helix-turn-helix domain-containing protein [Candidatus Dormibacteraeota bacterium]
MEVALITVRDVWRGALPEGTELLGGGSGLDRRVEWATTLRTRAPAFESVKGGEMALVPVASIRLLDERLDLADVMNGLAEKGGVAVAVVGDVSAASLAVAERRLMPLLRLPDGVSVAESQQAVVRYIVEQRTVLHERSQLVQMELIQLALSGAGSDAIVERLSDLTGRATAWHDASGRLRSVTGELPTSVREALRSGEELQLWVAGQTVHAADPPVNEFGLPRGRARLVAPIPGRDGVHGFVSIVAEEHDLGQVERVAVARAASACAIELDRERAVLRARDDLEGELVTALLDGSYGSETGTMERARRLGLDLDHEYAVLVIRARNSNTAAVDTVAIAARRCLLRPGAPALVAVHDGAVCAVVSTGENGDDGRLAAGTARAECAAALRDEVIVGLGRVRRGSAGVRQSHREAEQALRISVRLQAPRWVAAFADLGLHRLLVAMTQHAELDDFYRQTAGALIEYDARTGSGLMETLDAFFRCHGSPTDTALRLHLHRNTVLYRLRRIEEIGGLRLDDPATRLNLHLCLRIRDVLPAIASSPVASR